MRKRKFKRARKFGARVNRALKSVGTYNFTTLIDNMDTAPRIGTNAPLGAGFFGSWWNQSGGQNGAPTVELTQLVQYSGSPPIGTIQSTRQSTRIRLLRIEIFGSVKPGSAIVNNSGNRYWLDLEPMCWMEKTRPPTGSANVIGQSNIHPTEFYADRYGISASAIGTAGPNVFYLQPPSLQHGKHAFRKFKSREGLKRFNAQYQAAFLANTNPPAGTVGHFSGPVPASTGGDEIGFYKWTIPIDQICEYPRTNGQNANFGDTPALNPIYLDWHGRLSPSLQDLWDSAPNTDYKMATWSHFHIFIIYEDLLGLTV